MALTVEKLEFDFTKDRHVNGVIFADNIANMAGTILGSMIKADNMICPNCAASTLAAIFTARAIADDVADGMGTDEAIAKMQVKTEGIFEKHLKEMVEKVKMTRVAVDGLADMVRIVMPGSDREAFDKAMDKARNGDLSGLEAFVEGIAKRAEGKPH